MARNPKPDLSKYGNHPPNSDALEAYLEWRQQKGEQPETLRWKIWEGQVLFECDHQLRWEGFQEGYGRGNSHGWLDGNQRGYDSGWDDGAREGGR